MILLKIKIKKIKIKREKDQGIPQGINAIRTPLPMFRYDYLKLFCYFISCKHIW